MFGFAYHPFFASFNEGIDSILRITNMPHLVIPKCIPAQPVHAAFGIAECPHKSLAQGVPGRALFHAAPFPPTSCNLFMTVLNFRTSVCSSFLYSAGQAEGQTFD